MQTIAERKQYVATLTNEAFLLRCSCADLKKIRTSVLEQLNKRYKWTRNPKYGGLNRGFTDQELNTFFAACKNERATTMFLLQRYLGLRIGEVVRIKLSDLDLDHRKLYIFTEKARQPDCLYLHDDALRTLLTWLRNHQSQLRQQAYVFPGQLDGHASPHWLANQFRYTMSTIDINRTYGHSDPCGTHNRKRTLNRLTTHSFRHYFIRKLWKTTKDQMLVMKLARHRKFTSTQTYLQVQQEDMDTAMHLAFQTTEPLTEQDDTPTTLLNTT